MAIVRQVDNPVLRTSKLEFGDEPYSVFATLLVQALWNPAHSPPWRERTALTLARYTYGLAFNHILGEPPTPTPRAEDRRHPRRHGRPRLPRPRLHRPRGPRPGPPRVDRLPPLPISPLPMLDAILADDVAEVDARTPAIVERFERTAEELLREVGAPVPEDPPGVAGLPRRVVPMWDSAVRRGCRASRGVRPSLPVLLRALRVRVCAVPVRLQSDPDRVCAVPVRIRSNPHRLQSDPHRLQSDPHRLQSDPHRLQSDPHRLQSDPHRLQSDPHRLQSDPHRLQSDPHRLRIGSSPSPNRILTVSDQILTVSDRILTVSNRILTVSARPVTGTARSRSFSDRIVTFHRVRARKRRRRSIASASPDSSAPPAGAPPAASQAQPLPVGLGLGALGPPQTPDRQVAPAHGVPSGFAGFEHWPVEGSQAPNSWQSSAGAHSSTLPVHAPPLHAASCVQASVAQGMPSWRGVMEHMPVPSWQCSAALHVPAAGHAGTVQQTPSTQKPLAHVAGEAHASPLLDSRESTKAASRPDTPATIVAPSIAPETFPTTVDWPRETACWNARPTPSGANTWIWLSPSSVPPPAAKVPPLSDTVANPTSGGSGTIQSDWIHTAPERTKNEAPSVESTTAVSPSTARDAPKPKGAPLGGGSCCWSVHAPLARTNTYAAPLPYCPPTSAVSPFRATDEPNPSPGVSLVSAC